MQREIKFRAWDGSGKYVAGSDGLVYSTDFNHTGKMKALKGIFDKDGYHHVLLNIDGRYKNSLGEWVVARPNSGYGLLYLEIRLRMAWACLIGKADAVTFD